MAKADKKAAKEAKVVSSKPLDEQLKEKQEELKKDIARILTQINATKGDK